MPFDPLELQCLGSQALLGVSKGQIFFILYLFCYTVMGILIPFFFISPSPFLLLFLFCLYFLIFLYSSAFFLDDNCAFLTTYESQKEAEL